MGKSRVNKVTFLLESYNRNRDVKVYSPDTFGMRSWGSDSQESLEKKRKYWYISYWKAGNEIYLIPDSLESYKINVVLETQDVNKLLNYVENEYPHCLESVKKQIEEITKDYDMLMSWH